MQVRISSVAISVQVRSEIGCYPLSGAYRDNLLIIHKLSDMSCFDGLLCLFRQSSVLQDGRGGGSEQSQEVLCAATCAFVDEPGLSDLLDSEASGVKEGAAVDNGCVEDYEIMEGLLVEDVALDGVASTLSEVTVISPPCSAPAIMQAAPATKALRSDRTCSSESRFSAPTLDVTIVGNHVWSGPRTQTSSPDDIIPDAAAALRSLTRLALEAQRKFLTSGIA